MSKEIAFIHNHEDQLLLKEFQKHFIGKGFVIWDKGCIPPGSNASDEIKKHLHNAQIILVLVSATLLASNDFDENELPQILTRKKNNDCLIIPIILGPCDWEALLLGEPLPRDKKPISTLLQEPDRASAFYAIAKEIITKGNKSEGEDLVARIAPKTPMSKRISGLILAAVIILLIIAIGFFLVLERNKSFQPSITPTPTSKFNQATASANKKSNKTVQTPPPISTPTPTSAYALVHTPTPFIPTPTPIPTPAPISMSTPIYNDLLLNNSQGSEWLEKTGSCIFEPDGYHILLPRPQNENPPIYIQTCTPRISPVLRNFVLEVNMNILKGDEGGIVLLRTNAEEIYGYQFQPFQNIIKFGIGNGIIWDSTTPSLVAHKQYNLKIIATNTTFKFYINQEYIGTAADLSGAPILDGDLGLAVHGEHEDSEVVFSDLKIWNCDSTDNLANLCQ